MQKYRLLAGLAIVAIGFAALLTAGCFTREYRVELRAEPEDGGEVRFEGTYRRGQDIAVKAEAREGYRFVEWTEDGNRLSRSWNYPFIVRGHRSLVAHFEKIEDE